jgi:predicted metal-dependent hydrolase
LGRPLPYGADGVERVPEGLTLPPAEALSEAQRLFDRGRPFHAHEVLEGTWKAAPAEERQLWQGLAQLAVGLTHAMRGNATGALSVVARGRDRIAGYADAPPYGIDVAGLISWADQLLAVLAEWSKDPPGGFSPPQLRRPDSLP